MKLLIADDEVQIRIGLAEGIDWQAFGIDTVLTAENGVDAYDQCRTHKPELIITDIRMPGIDGLQLSRQVMDLYAPVKIIVLSGYSEFSYAQESLKIGVADYLLKPIDIAELEIKVVQCTTEISQQRNGQALRSAYTRHHRQSQLCQRFSRSLVLDTEEMKDFVDYVQMRVFDTCFVAMVSVDDAPERLLPQILAYVTAALPTLEKERCSCLFSDPRSVVLLVPAFFRTRMEERLRAWQVTLNSGLEAQFRTGVSVAVSDTGTLSLAPVLYDEARMVMNHRTHFGGKGYLRWDEVKLLSGFDEHLSLPYTQLEESIRLLQPERIDALMTEYFAQFRRRHLTRTEPLQAACIALENLLVTVLKERGLTEETLLHREKEPMEELPQYVTVDGYEEWAKALCERVFRQIQLLEGRACSKEVMQAVDYILRHYTENIALEDVAEMVGKSKNYFSSLFKKNMGMSFVDYITHVRVTEACRLLDTTTELTYEIAAKVGFGDYKYFSAVFKKITGHSPSHYRRQQECAH